MFYLALVNTTATATITTTSVENKTIQNLKQFNDMKSLFYTSK